MISRFGCESSAHSSNGPARRPSVGESAHPDTAPSGTAHGRRSSPSRAGRDIRRKSDGTLDVHGLCPVSPQDSNVGDAQGSVNARDVLDDRSRAEDRAEDLPNQSSFRQLPWRNSEDEDLANPLPPPRGL